MRGLSVAAAVTAALTLALSTVQSSPPATAGTTAEDPVPRLPPPTGRHAVGTTSLHLVDTSRPDPWEPSAPHRELMVSVFYPAARGHGPTRRFLTTTEAAAVLEEAGITEVTPEQIASTRTNAVVDARPVGRRHSRPLIVLSPGFKRPRATLSTLAEDLASHGNVVAVIDHTYENVATTFPDGRVTPCTACGSYDPEFWHRLRTGRAADVSFVLDELTGPRPRWRGADLIDATRIAMGGHSVGGAATLVALLTDERILAGFDADGTADVELPDTGVTTPFLLIGRANTYTPGTGPESRSWEEVWPQLNGWRRWLVVDGMQHPSFTDIGLVGEQLGLDFGADTPAVRGAAILRAYTRAFLDLHLRGTPRPLITAPSPDYPEVTFVG